MLRCEVDSPGGSRFLDEIRRFICRIDYEDDDEEEARNKSPHRKLAAYSKMRCAPVSAQRHLVFDDGPWAH
jgi:hypothetical protein